MKFDINDLRKAISEGDDRIFVTVGVMSYFLRFADRLNYQPELKSAKRLHSLLKQASVIDPLVGSIFFQNFPPLQSTEPIYFVAQRFLFRVVVEGSGYRVASVRLAPETFRVGLQNPEKAAWLARVVFTHHALERFSERFGMINGVPPRNPERTATRLLADALEDELSDRVRFERLMRNGCKEVKYYFSQGWRFVITEEELRLVVVTIERTF